MEVDLLTYTCGQRGLVHRIVHSMISSGLFLACGCDDDGYGDPQAVARSRAEALSCARSVRNRKTVTVLLEAFPELQ